MPISELQVRQFTFDCVERLGSLTTIDDISAELRRAGAALGFESFCISGLPSAGERLDPYVLLSGWPDAWLERYAREGYVHRDPVIRKVRQTTMPFAWSEAPLDPDDREGARIMREAPQFGLVDGLAVPIYTTHGFQAIVTFGAHALSLSKDERAGLHLIAIYAHGQARNLLTRREAGRSPSPSHLSQREIDCLRWAASGKSAWDIGTILGLSQRTIEEYLSNAAMKLGAVNRVQCVAEAIRRKIIP
ncbi:LuxR family transcriptional regulator [Microvirga pudoricolor]|uniref:LuxR family transcriptional regulator n=1 Tax=Microvirga pudoricolor TaxID=2778729 RepID=UPI0019528882|nr:LuxR family transcriptional regulator [Microvirga pudoricolor]MBM6593481.1 LuxR family transcriptional regulator [Microvirga pudoricolor]